MSEDYWCVRNELSLVGQASAGALEDSFAKNPGDYDRYLSRMQFLSDDAHIALRQRLLLLYNEWRKAESDMLLLLTVIDAYESEPPEYEIFLLKLPLLEKAKRYSLVKTVEYGWSWYVRLYWLVFFALAVWRMGLYGVYAIIAPGGNKVAGPGLPPEVHDEYHECHGDYYMPFDIRMMWQYGPRNNIFRGMLALLSAGAAAYGCAKEIGAHVDAFHKARRMWSFLVRVVCAMRVMRDIHRCVVDNQEIRQFSDCRALYNFFEATGPGADVITQVRHLSESTAFDPLLGGFWWSGHNDRLRELLPQGVQALSAAVVAVGRLELYACANLTSGLRNE